MISPHIIEVALLILAAYLIGCVVGALARRLLSPRQVPTGGVERVSPMTQSAISAAAAGAAAAAGQATMAEAARDPGEVVPAPVESKPMPLVPETVPATAAEDEALMEQEDEEELPPVPDTPEPTERP